MDPRTLEGKRVYKEKVMSNKEDGIVDDDFEDEEEEIAGGGGGVGDEKKKGGVGIMQGKRGGSSGGGGGVALPSCQVEKCGIDLSEAKRYHRRHKVCEVHSKAPAVIVAGLRQRFCQQCSRFHELAEFDETKRSCRRRLAGHNERRRKSTGTAAESYVGEGSNRKESQCSRQVDHHERSRFQTTLPANPNFKRSQIR